jgi:hypothetical protein
VQVGVVQRTIKAFDSVMGASIILIGMGALEIRNQYKMPSQEFPLHQVRLVCSVYTSCDLVQEQEGATGFD